MKYTLEHAKQVTDIHEHLVTLHGLVLEVSAKLAIELGVGTGQSTVALLEGVHETDGRLVSVDGATCIPARQMIESYGLAGRWEFHLHHDVYFGQHWDRGPADLVFVDTSHQYGHTKEEIEVFEPLVRPGGIMAFHDTVTYAAGVMVPIQEFLRTHPGYRFENRENCNGLGILRKPKAEGKAA